MSDLSFGFVDVFAERPLEGNPLAVVEGGETLPDDVLRAIAREFNQSETTFILQPQTKGVDWRLRSFTAAGVEVCGAGHNALGAWLWLGYRGRLGALDAPREFRQEIGGAVLPVRLERRGDLLFGTMVHSPFKREAFRPDVAQLAAALGLRPDDILLEPEPCVGSTGAAHLLVRLRDRATVDRADPDGPALVRAVGSEGDRGCYLYAFEGDGVTRAYARFFNPAIGLSEDAATGSAAGPLGAYLAECGLLRSDATLVIEQGAKIGRRSLLTVSVAPRVELSGPGLLVMEGRLRL